MAGQYYEWIQNPCIYRDEGKPETIKIYNLVERLGGHATPLPAELRITQNGKGKVQASIFSTFRADFTLKHLIDALEAGKGLEEQHRDAIDGKVLVEVQHDVVELRLEERPQ